MLRIDIVTADGGTPWTTFDTQDEVNAYIADVTASQKWGQSAWTEIVTPAIPEIPAVPAVLDANGNVVTPAVAEVPAVPAVTVNHPATWSYTVTDITAQVALQTAVAKGLQAQQVGATAVATVYAINEANLASGALTNAQFTAMLADTTIASIERLLGSGSLATALALVQSYNTTLLTYFTAAQIAQIEAVITASGLV